MSGGIKSLISQLMRSWQVLRLLQSDSENFFGPKSQRHRGKTMSDPHLTPTLLPNIPGYGPPTVPRDPPTHAIERSPNDKDTPWAWIAPITCGFELHRSAFLWRCEPQFANGVRNVGQVRAKCPVSGNPTPSSTIPTCSSLLTQMAVMRTQPVSALSR
jgi:hypothetical protein